MKFGLMYEIQIPEPHYDGIEQDRYKHEFIPMRAWVAKA